MRISSAQSRFLKEEIRQHLPSAKTYLFGSRADEQKRGGDIDILVIGSRPLTLQEKRKIKIAFFRRFGEQKVDLVSFREGDPSPFKKIAEMEGVPL